MKIIIEMQGFGSGSAFIMFLDWDPDQCLKIQLKNQKKKFTLQRKEHLFVVKRFQILFILLLYIENFNLFTSVRDPDPPGSEIIWPQGSGSGSGSGTSLFHTKLKNMF
jgi:hypothetical protein